MRRGRSHREGRFGLLLLGAVLVLSGCEAAVGVATPMIWPNKKVNVLNASYAAADILAQKSQTRFSRLDPLVLYDPNEIPDLSNDPVLTNPKVGVLLGSQLRERFTQLGYTLVEPQTVPDLKKAGRVEGTYSLKDGVMKVALKMYGSKDRLVATHDYTLPITYDIKRHMTRSAHGLPPIPPLFN